MKICGYAVIRRAKFNFLDDLTPPCVGGIYYHGVKRQSWTEIDNNSPFHYYKLYRGLINTGIIELTRNLEIAQDLLNYSNETEKTSEIVAIYSKSLEKAEGSFITDVNIKWLGEDIACWVGSMLMEGIFTKPYIFEDFKPHLNQYGLFDIDSPIVDDYVVHYNKLNAEGYLMEIFSDVMHFLDRVWVGIPEIQDNIFHD